MAKLGVIINAFVLYILIPMSYLCNIVKNVIIALSSDIYKMIYFKLSVVIETTVIYMCLFVMATLTFIQGHSCIRHQSIRVVVVVIVVFLFVWFFFYEFKYRFRCNSVCCHNLLVC